MKELALAGRQGKLLRKEADKRENRKYSAIDVRGRASYDQISKMERSRQYRDTWKRWLLWSEVDKKASRYEP